MKIGFNLLLWTGEVTEEHFGILDGIKEAGYDGVELPMFAANPSHYEKLDKELSRVHGKLNNPNFVNKAPAAVVEKERAKADDIESALGTLKEQLASFA